MGKVEDEATELALRAAFLRDREDGEPLDLTDILNDVQDYRRQFSSSANFRSVVHDISDSQSIQEAAIKTAFKGLQYAYDRVADQVHAAREINEELGYEIEAEFASFQVPMRGELTSEERSMKAFYELASKAETPWLIRFLGISKKVPKEITEKTYYRVLPLVKVRKEARQSLVSPSLLDEVRTDINLFLSVEAVEVLGVLERHFRKSSAYQSTPEKTRLARIFILALCRLLWALSHQVDLDTGRPSTTKRCFDRCSRAQIYLNSILNSKKAPCLANKTKDDKCLISFIRSTDDLIKNLRYAYATEQLNELNMENLTSSVYESLDILTQGIFTLLYRRHDSNEQKYLPDETAASSIKKDLASLTRLLKTDDSRLDVFRVRAHLVPEVNFLNKRATTLIDVLIIFCHLPHSDRSKLMDELNEQRHAEGFEVEWAITLARRLKIFEKHFITPVEYQGEVYKDSAEPFNPHKFFPKMTMTYHKAQEKSKLAGRRLIPFLTLLMATRCSTAYALSGEELSRSDGLNEAYLNASLDMHRTGWQQLQAINEQAKNQTEKDRAGEMTDERAYFERCMSLFMYGSADVNPQLSVLPHLHDRMRDLAQLLELVFKMHKQLSKSQVFYSFFIECLDWVGDEQTRLGRVITEFKTENKHGVNRYIQEILLPMELDLSKNFKEIQQAVKDSKRTVTDSKFMERIEENTVKDIEDIHKLVSRLFNKDSNLLQLISHKGEPSFARHSFVPSLTSSTLSRSSSDDNKALQKYALQELMEDSYKSMSYFSRFYSQKGPILSALIAEVSLKSVLSDKELHDYLEKLIRVASSYRRVWFFPFAEAQYGLTETMKSTILPAMKNVRINAILPFSAVIFNGHQADLTRLTDDKIIQALNKQRVEHDWEHSEDEIFEEDFLGSSHASSPANMSSAPDRRQMMINFRRQQARRSSSMSYFDNQDAVFQLNASTRKKASDDSLTTQTESRNSDESKKEVVNV
ncbi:MAG: hypothetical protein P1U36_01790 [Legionellaceae bacterium]|nr:hypothetical protein [Legionellaceae bacterium]